MKKMTITIISCILLAIILFLIMSRVEVTFSPFSFKILYALRGIGWVILVAGMALIEHSAKNRGHDELYKDTMESIESIRKMRKNAEETMYKASVKLGEAEEIYKTLKEDEKESR